ncbi:MAG TPA: PepSY domain-containing protein [Planctomycetota bacterium]|nr:PepSY domain-containing protein [Planctomycetota bacterium]
MQRITALCLAAVLSMGLITASCEAGEKKKDEPVALDQLPEAVKNAAQAAVKNIVLSKAEKKTKKGTVTYQVEGKADGKEWEIKLSPEGQVLKIKEEKQDGDKDDKAKSASKPVPPPAPPKGDF